MIIKNPSTKIETTITSDDLTIVFSTHVYDTSSSSESYGAKTGDITAEIGVFNLAQSTIDNIQHEDSHPTNGEDVLKSGGSTVTLISGYRDHHDVIFSGVVASIMQEEYGADVLTILGCRESNAIVKNAVISHTFSADPYKNEPPIQLSQIVSDIATMAGIPIGRIDPTMTTTISRTYDTSQSVDDIFKEICDEVNLNGEKFRYKFNQGAVYFLDASSLKRELYDLTPETGLLSAKFNRNPVYVNDSYDIVALLLPDIRWGHGVKITIKDQEYVCAVTTPPIHVSDGQQHCTKFLATIGEEI